MTTLKIDQEKARQLYPTATPEFKVMLEDSFGKEFFNQKITDRIQNFDDILRIAGKTMADLQKPGDTDDEVAYKQAKLIALVYNAGELLPGSDTSVYKYFPWHKVSGSGLSSGGCAGWASYSDVGVRLCFKESSHAVDAGKKFLDIYTRLKIK